MKIAIDYDNTYTLDPNFWNLFIVTAKNAGHLPFIVTHRERHRDSNDQLAEVEEKLCPVFYTGGVAKRWWCLHWGPGEVHVWIDDKPEGISTNSAMPMDALTKWREECASREPGHPGPQPYNHL